MALKKKPVTGMKDVMPAEMEIRDYCISVIKKTYAEFGFQGIETPCVEDIGNLTSKSGGDNEKLIFKILKRGEKLRLADAKTEADLVDGGLRYDLTVPLVRYYAAHENELAVPFKALQMGNVWRADRPQKGRYRQFMQCDIDIIGEPSNLAEIELILATTTTLGRLGFQNFQIRINERRILKAMARYSGFPEERFDEVFITLDKMDKIGRDGVRSELSEAGFTAEAVDKYLTLFDGLDAAGGAPDAAARDNNDAPAGDDRDPAVSGGTVAVGEGGAGSDDSARRMLTYLETVLEGCIEPDVIPNLRETIETVEAAKQADFRMVFDPTIVRGMSYYTGTIFEIAMPELGISAGGGGRYDGMVGKFTGRDVPACGFSIGFERIILILLEQGYKVPGQKEKVAILLEKNLPSERLAGAMARAQELRAEGRSVLVVRMNKNKKFQKQQLEQQGYTAFEEIYARPLD